jgi:hypothetical protein
MSLLSREYHYSCRNIKCLHTWVVISSAVRTIVPSRMPNPDVHIPLAGKDDPVLEPSPSG